MFTRLEPELRDGINGRDVEQVTGRANHLRLGDAAVGFDNDLDDDEAFHPRFSRQLRIPHEFMKPRRTTNHLRHLFHDDEDLGLGLFLLFLNHRWWWRGRYVGRRLI